MERTESTVSNARCTAIVIATVAAIFAPLICAVIFDRGASASAATVAERSHDAERYCFARDEWGAAAGHRPCAVVIDYAPVCVRVSDANGRDSAIGCLRYGSAGTDGSVRITRIYEDGSVCLRIATRSGIRRDCIGNPRD